MMCRGLVVASATLLAAPASLCAQLAVDDLSTGLSAEDLVAAILGPGVTATNVSFSGDDTAGGLFGGGFAALGFDAGVVLGTGNVGFVVPLGGLNSDDGVSQGNFRPGDPDLDPFVPAFGTFDAAVLEFDFECPTGGVLTLEYVLASEEYNEFVNGFYNDAFGIFVNGVNVALLPDGVTPVSINTVNGGNPLGVDAANPEFFINNDCDDLYGEMAPCVPAVPIEMDGLTVVLTASVDVPAGVNHVKIAIADGGDQSFDSNVFIRSGSFACASDEPPGGGDPTGGCQKHHGGTGHWSKDKKHHGKGSKHDSEDEDAKDKKKSKDDGSGKKKSKSSKPQDTPWKKGWKKGWKKEK